MIARGRVSGRVLFRRESGLLDVAHDFRSRKVLLLLTAIVVLGGGLAIALSQVIGALPTRGDGLRPYLEFLVLGLAAGFFLLAAALAIEDRGFTVITDAGILYGGIFRRWAEVRCCAMRKTRRGLIVWTLWSRPRRRLRMYFRGRDTENIERLFLDLCGADAFVPDCGRSLH